MSDFVKNIPVLQLIAEFSVESIYDSIRLSNTCHGFREAMEEGNIWREMFEKRWPQLKILSFDDPRFCVIKEFQLDLICDKMPREYNKADFPKRVKKQLEVRSRKGIKCSYRYPLNWFRGFSNIFGFYGESEKQDGPTDLGPHFITQVQVVTRKVFRRQEDVQTGGRMRYILSVSRYAGDVEDMIHRKIYYFMVDGFLQSREKFLQRFITFVLDFSGIGHEQIRAFLEPPPDSVVESIPPSGQSWVDFEDAPFFGILNCEKFMDFHIMVDEYGKRNDYKHFLYKCRLSINASEFSLELVMMKKKVNDEKAYIESLLNPKLKKGSSMSEYVADSVVDELVSSDLKKMESKNRGRNKPLKKSGDTKKKTAASFGKKKGTKVKKSSATPKKKKATGAKGKLYSGIIRKNNVGGGGVFGGGEQQQQSSFGSLGISGKNVSKGSPAKKKNVRKVTKKKTVTRKKKRVAKK